MQLSRQLKNTNTPQLLDFAIIGVLVLLYAPILLHWLNGWANKTISTEHEYFSHGIIGIPFAGYLAWTNRKLWQRLPDTLHPLGAALLIVGGVFYLGGVTDWVNMSLPLILTGLCLLFKGMPGLKLQGFSLLLLLLATPNPVPYLIAPYTLPLQSFIAGTAGFILTQLGMQVTVEEINIFVGGRIVEVAPYCAGLKMLFTTTYVSLMLLYWTSTLTNRRTSLWFISISIILSVVANIIRNTILTYFHGTGNDAAFKWLHDSWGGDLYSAGLLMLLIPVLNRIDSYFSEVPQPTKEESGE